MVYNTEQQIRDMCGMAASTPTSAQITRWQTLVDALILTYNSSPDENIAAIIEANRIGRLWNARKKLSGNDKWKDEAFDYINPLSKEEKELLQTEDIMVDSIPMNGQRQFTGRR